MDPPYYYRVRPPGSIWVGEWCNPEWVITIYPNDYSGYEIDTFWCREDVVEALLNPVWSSTQYTDCLRNALRRADKGKSGVGF